MEILARIYTFVKMENAIMMLGCGIVEMLYSLFLQYSIVYYWRFFVYAYISPYQPINLVFEANLTLIPYMRYGRITYAVNVGNVGKSINAI